MTTVEVGGFTFYGMRHPSHLHYRRMIDWEGLPQSKSNPEPRAGAHGSFGTSRVFREGVVTSLEGHCSAPDRVTALRTRTRLSAAMAADELTVTVTDELGPTSREVEARRVKLGDVYGSRFEIAIDFFAEDPRRYGPELVASTGLPASGTGMPFPVVFPVSFGTPGNPGQAIVENVGTTGTFPRYEATGGTAGGISIQSVEDGREIRFERVLPLGSTLFVDSRTGQAWIDDPANDLSGFLTRADWWEIPAESHRTIQFNALGAVDGTPTLTVRTAPAYW